MAVLPTGPRPKQMTHLCMALVSQLLQEGAGQRGLLETRAKITPAGLSRGAGTRSKQAPPEWGQCRSDPRGTAWGLVPGSNPDSSSKHLLAGKDATQSV